MKISPGHVNRFIQKTGTGDPEWFTIMENFMDEVIVESAREKERLLKCQGFGRVAENNH